MDAKGIQQQLWLLYKLICYSALFFICDTLYPNALLDIKDKNHQNFIESHDVVFTLNKIRLEGNYFFTETDLAPLYAHKINKNVTFEDLEKIAHSITNKYHASGFFLSRAFLPAQVIKNGTVYIQIFEGHISHFENRITTKKKNDLLKKYSEKIMASTPLKIETLERFTLLADDMPGMTTQSILMPSKTKMAGSELYFVGQEESFVGSLGIDNRGTRYLGKHQFFLSGNMNSVFRSGDTTGIQGLFTNKKKGLHLIRFEHQQFLGSNGTELNISESISNSNPGYILSPLNILGKSNIFSTIVSHPFIRSRCQNLYISSTFDLIRNNTNAMNSVLFYDKITSLRCSIAYDKIDSWYGSNFSEITFSKGLPIFGASPKNSYKLSRYNGRSDYSKIMAQVSRIQNLNNLISILFAFRGQYAFNNLLSAEQITYGGVQFGRAYDASEISGDKGIEGKIELRYTRPLSKFDKKSYLPKLMEYYLFYDFGAFWNPLPEMTSFRSSGTSIGTGIRVNFDQMFCYGELAKPLTRQVAANRNKNLRFFFGLYLKF